MRTFKSYIIVANYIVLILFLTFVGISFYSGGVKPSTIWWVGLAPVVAALLLNGFYSVMWFIIITTEMICLYYLKIYGYLPASAIPVNQMDKFLTTSTTFGIFFITVLCIITDKLRERISLEKEELQDKSFRLTQLASLGSLASGLAHEINNPLTVINGSQLKIRRMLENNEEIDKNFLENYMSKIEKNVKRIQEITASMKTISDQESNKQIVQIDMAKLLMAIVEAAQQKIGLRKISIKTIFKEDVFFNGIYKEINQALYNIVENSIDELIDMNIETGAIEITLDSDLDEIVMYFKDNGRGIPKEYRDKIFDPFFTTKPVGQGTGLGLTYSLNMITYNGGTLELLENESTSSGAIFKVVLPIT